ncbi:MAG: PhzF family phenazine biosynthesis protein [Pseudomonadota bacterium]
MPQTQPNFSIVDVFTDTRFLGNPVAVIHDATGLSQDQMQAIAREFGFSETTFILPPEGPAYTARVRIFTPLQEIPFAGHPNIGTAFVIGTQTTAAAHFSKQEMVFDERGGDVAVRLMSQADTVVGASISAPQSVDVLGTVPPETIARCLGLDPADVLSQSFAPCVASVGLPFAFAELASLDHLSAATPDQAAFRAAATAGPQTVDEFAICAFTVLDRTPERLVIRSRVFCPLGHPPEDPATGSASGALGALFSPPEGAATIRYDITQGVEMGRKSEIRVELANRSEPPRISGQCVLVATGQLHL